MLAEPTSGIRISRDHLGDLPNVTYLEGSLETLPFHSRQFDFIYALGWLSLFPGDPARSIATLARYLKPRGELVLWVFGPSAARRIFRTGWRGVTWVVPQRLCDGCFYAVHGVETWLQNQREKRAPAAMVRAAYLRWHRGWWARWQAAMTLWAPYLRAFSPAELEAYCRAAKLTVVARGTSPISLRARKE